MEAVADYGDIENLRQQVAEAAGDIGLVMGHYPYRDLVELFPTGLRATLLREPVARTISILRQTRAAHFERDTSLEEVYANPRWFAAAIHNHQTKVFALPAASAKGVFTAVDLDGSDLDRARSALEEVDILGVTEDFEDFWVRLSARFGFEPDPPGRLNEGTDDGEVSAELLARIAEDNVLDLELYEHARSLLSA